MIRARGAPASEARFLADFQRSRTVRIGLVVSIGRVTAKEKLLERAPHWTEEQAARALRAAEGELDDWGDLHAQTRALAEQAETRLRERERAAGDAW